jgi:adenosylcobyric acid synthase
LPRVSNFTDFQPLFDSGLFRARWAERPEELRGADLVVVPGTKSTMGDLQALGERGLAEAIRAAHRAGSRVLGVCGGYQILGERILDPGGAESELPDARGLGLLPVTTTFEAEKVTVPVRVRGAVGGWLGPEVAVEGYEIHMGRTEGAAPPLFQVQTSGGESRPEGAVSLDGRVAGTYVHGLFDHFSAVAGFAKLLGVSQHRIDHARPAWLSRHEAKGAAYDRLAASFRQHLDLSRIRELLYLEED